MTEIIKHIFKRELLHTKKQTTRIIKRKCTILNA